MTTACSIMMRMATENFYDKGMKHCDDKLLEHCDEKIMEPRNDKSHGAY